MQEGQNVQKDDVDTSDPVAQLDAVKRMAEEKQNKGKDIETAQAESSLDKARDEASKHKLKNMGFAMALAIGK